MISFVIDGNSEDSANFVTSTKLFTLAESLGGIESLLEQPSTMTLQAFLLKHEKL